jgi:hypothetical protein
MPLSLSGKQKGAIFSPKAITTSSAWQAKGRAKHSSSKLRMANFRCASGRIG